MFEEPVKILDVTNRVDYSTWISTIVAICSLLFIAYDKFLLKSKVYGKIITKTTTEKGRFVSDNNEILGQKYMFKLSLSCLRKDFHYKDVKVKLVYGKEIVDGVIYWVNTPEVLDYGNGVRKRLNIPAKDFISFNNVLEKNKTKFMYITIIVPDREGNELCDMVDLTFVRPNNRELKVRLDEIDANQYLVEEHLFADISS